MTIGHVPDEQLAVKSRPCAHQQAIVVRKGHICDFVVVL